MMINRKYAACGLLIIAAIAASVLIITVNRKADINVSEVIQKIEDVLPPYIEGKSEMRYNTEMPMMSIDGHDYVGILEIPSKQIKLPVCSCWDEHIAKSIPCRYSGSIYSDLIIGGKNKKDNFDFLNTVDIGDTVSFVDMTGQIYNYKVNSVYHKKEFDIEVAESKLVMFTYLNDVSKYVFVTCE